MNELSAAALSLRDALPRLSQAAARASAEAGELWFSLVAASGIPDLIVARAAAVQSKIPRLEDTLSDVAAVENPTSADQLMLSRAVDLATALRSEVDTLNDILAAHAVVSVDVSFILPTLEQFIRDASRALLTPVREVGAATRDVLVDVGEGAGSAARDIGGGALDAVGRGWVFGLLAFVVFLRSR